MPREIETESSRQQELGGPFKVLADGCKLAEDSYKFCAESLSNPIGRVRQAEVFVDGLVVGGAKNLFNKPVETLGKGLVAAGLGAAFKVGMSIPRISGPVKIAGTVLLGASAIHTAHNVSTDTTKNDALKSVFKNGDHKTRATAFKNIEGSALARESADWTIGLAGGALGMKVPGKAIAKGLTREISEVKQNTKTLTDLVLGEKQAWETLTDTGRYRSVGEIPVDFLYKTTLAGRLHETLVNARLIKPVTRFRVNPLKSEIGDQQIAPTDPTTILPTNDVNHAKLDLELATRKAAATESPVETQPIDTSITTSKQPQITESTANQPKAGKFIEDDLYTTRQEEVRKILDDLHSNLTKETMIEAEKQIGKIQENAPEYDKEIGNIQDVLDGIVYELNNPKPPSAEMSAAIRKEMTTLKAKCPEIDLKDAYVVASKKPLVLESQHRDPGFPEERKYGLELHLKCNAPEKFLEQCISKYGMLRGLFDPWNKKHIDGKDYGIKISFDNSFPQGLGFYSNLFRALDVSAFH